MKLEEIEILKSGKCEDIKNVLEKFIEEVGEFLILNVFIHNFN